MAQRSGINRGFMWLRKVLEITEKTDVPQVLSEVARPVVDMFGWERLPTSASEEFIGSDATDNVVSLQVPDGFVQLITAASVETTEAVSTALWLTKRPKEANQQIALVSPVAVLSDLQVALTRPIVLLPGERLIGRSPTGTPAVGENLTLRFSSVLLPIGEYIPPV